MATFKRIDLCPSCDHRNRPDYADITTKSRDQLTAYYVCAECGTAWRRRWTRRANEGRYRRLPLAV